MSISIDTQDLENYPGTTKRITLALDSIVPVGNEGDESFVLTAATSAYSNNDDKTTIQDLYITSMRAGWCKSSGFTGSSGKFYIDSTHKSLKIKMDATVSGTDGNGYYTITLTPNDDNTPVSGEVIAEDMEDAIRALADNLEAADTGFTTAYRDASVEYSNGKFWIVSGSISSYYTGSSRSSVIVAEADTNDCTAVLGFNLPTTSYGLASIAIKETVLNSDYTADTDTVNVNTGTAASEGMAFMITDGTNTEYFTALSGTTESAIKVAVSGTNGFTAITHDYSANEAKLQLLREQDPEGSPTCWYDTVDSLVKYGIKNLASQIDYSS